ncbi:hypothetical protein HY933_04660 [Candidatus Falkowbacteria bacterium]|nr:hypothetical protein [Candidatus Falkowbacteria bacterium]
MMRLIESLDAKVQKWFGIQLIKLWDAKSQGNPPVIVRLDEKHEIVFRSVFGSDDHTFSGYRIEEPTYCWWVPVFRDEYVATIFTGEYSAPFNTQGFEANSGVENINDLEKEFKGMMGAAAWEKARKELEEVIQRRLKGGAPKVTIYVSGTLQLDVEGIINASAKYATRLFKSGNADQIINGMMELALAHVFGSMMLESALILAGHRREKTIKQLMNLMNFGCLEVDEGGEPIEATRVTGIKGLRYYGLRLVQFGIKRIVPPEEIEEAIRQEESAERERVADKAKADVAAMIHDLPAALAFTVMHLTDAQVKGPGLEISVSKNKKGKSGGAAASDSTD